ncbi:MAG: sigma-70 family RNA polymerase sigma factor [Planctomycetaceae bacterium]|nr:sigma-70 family RNA polymerase sigma factor [Planctomycetaceae bacterium]
MVASDDLRLIESTLAGDTEAFGELVLRYQDRLCGTLVHMLGSVHDARDVAQEAFLLAFEKLETFRRESSFYSWLFRIAYNAAISQRRKERKNRRSIDHQKDQTGSEPTDSRPANDPAYQLEIEDSQRQVREALDELGEEYRDAIVLKELEGLRYEEIAEILGCPIGTVRSRIHRARQLLREKLARVTEREQT